MTLEELEEALTETLCECGRRAVDHEQLTPPVLYLPGGDIFWVVRGCDETGCKKFKKKQA